MNTTGGKAKAEPHIEGVSRKSEERRELWRRKIAPQEQSGESVRAFCGKQGVREPSDYYGTRSEAAGELISELLLPFKEGVRRMCTAQRERGSCKRTATGDRALRPPPPTRVADGKRRGLKNGPPLGNARPWQHVGENFLRTFQPSMSDRMAIPGDAGAVARLRGTRSGSSGRRTEDTVIGRQASSPVLARHPEAFIAPMNLDELSAINRLIWLGQGCSVGSPDILLQSGFSSGSEGPACAFESWQGQRDQRSPTVTILVIKLSTAQYNFETDWAEAGGGPILRRCPLRLRESIIGHARRREQAHDEDHDWIQIRRDRTSSSGQIAVDVCEIFSGSARLKFTDGVCHLLLRRQRRFHGAFIALSWAVMATHDFKALSWRLTSPASGHILPSTLSRGVRSRFRCPFVPVTRGTGAFA
jgi:hypothetical protein